MRLWHSSLIPVLPQKQLIAQWREIRAIYRSIILKGTPNHRLVNILQDYHVIHFKAYTLLITNEIKRRGYRVDSGKLEEVMNMPGTDFSDYDPDSLYQGWFNKRYLQQCYYNLQEKADRSIVPQDEWEVIQKLLGQHIT